MTVPNVVHRQLLRWAAQALDELPNEQVPSALRPVAKFRANRRATLGAAPLASALESDAGFRAAVAAHARSLGVEPAGDADVVARAAAAHLFGAPEANELLAEAAATGEVAALRAANEQLSRDLAKARAAREPAPAPRSSTTAPESGSDRELQATVERLRQRLRDQGTALREAREAAAAAEERAATEIRTTQDEQARAVAELRSLRTRLEQEQVRADRAQQHIDGLQESQRGAREAADRRVDLLLGVLEQASAGLRRELHPATGGPDPAERVGETLVAPRAARVGDVASLNGWLSMPLTHLIVDGYNVTKSGYPQLTLAEQRERLVRELAGLAARTSAEVTVVFDGASVLVPQTRARGIRVLFSPPGVPADDVICRLLDAEPPGRPMLVATADREIVASAAQAGARSVDPEDLIAVLADGR